MNELIKIQQHNGRQAVSARELYDFLEVGTEFAKWCNRMFEYGFEEDKDFTPILTKSTGGRPSVDYAITLDCAKEIAMIQRTPQGKQAREYFISCEKKLQEIAKPLSTLDMLEMSIKQLREQESRVIAVEKDIKQLKAQTKTRPDYYTIVGYATLQGIDCGLKLASKLGRMASKICKERNIIKEDLPDPRFGKVYTYPEHVLSEVFEECVLV